MTIEPDEDYVIPFGKARTVQTANENCVDKGASIAIITYGMGVYWATSAAKDYKDQVEIIDLRTLNPLDKEAMYTAARKHGRVMVLTEESVESTFSLGLVARIQKECFEYLDAPVELVGSIDTPAIPLNSVLEATLLPNSEKVSKAIGELLKY
jgi:2-oxoisovalerate dehydrogenase E1 component